MKKIIDINAEDYRTVHDKITINIKNFEIDTTMTIIKCFKNLEDVTTLEAKRINLVKIQKSLFLNLTNLQTLDLRDNRLDKLSKNFIILKKLKILKLDDNCLSYFPCFLTKLDNLEYLSMSMNNITSIPSSIQNLQKLKTLKLSNNKISSIPIEFGLLKSLESLFIEANHFTEIPTTLCYLKHLSELSFEWLEFLEPQFNKIIRENIGKTIISLIRNSLQEMIKQNILYCDFWTFIEKNSNHNENEEAKKDKSITHDAIKDKKFLKIFHAIEDDYYGVIKALITNNDEYLKVKNNDNKTPLYMAIHTNKFDITNLIVKKLDLSKIPNNHIYLHKAIRMRDPYLTQQFIDIGIDVNAPDDQGATCMHVLFSAFTKNYSKCILIGDMLLQYNIRLNVLNNDNWAPIHIAARRSSKECLMWIVSQNKVLKELEKDYFDLNIKGKNKWTPLHLSVNGFRFEETMILLDNNCDVFAKNSDYKIPRKVSNGNYLLTKLLRNYEFDSLSRRYIQSDMYYNHHNNNCFTTVEDVSNADDFSSIIKENKLYKDFPKEIISNISEDLSINNQIKKNESGLKKSSNTIDEFQKQSNSKIAKINSSQNNFNDTPKFFQNKSLKSTGNIGSIAKQSGNLFSSGTVTTNSFNNKNKINLHFHKEVILNYENSLAEKYESIMMLKLASTSNLVELEQVLRCILESLDVEYQPNSMIFIDLCSLIVMNQFFNLIPYLEIMKNKIQNKRGKFYTLMDLEISNTIYILESVQETFKKTIILANKPLTVIPKKPKKSKKGRSKPLKENNNTNSIINKNKNRNLTKDSINEDKGINALPNMEIINKYFEKEKYKHTDGFQSDDMNERSHSNIDLRNYQNQVPKSGFNKIEDDSVSGILESCNVLDSSYSIIKYDDNKTSGLTLRSNNKLANVDYTIIPPKRLESSSYLDFDN